MAAKLRITVVRCAIDIRPLSALLRRLTAALAYMIQRCKPVQNAAELMAQEVAEWPVEHLERVGFVAMTAGDWPRGLGWDSRADQPAIGLRMGRSDEGSPPPPAAGGQSAQQVQYRCPGATVVWVNEKSHIYHFPGTHDYGNTKRGAYMCEADAQAASHRAAKNETHS
jgi:hypothetical protein